MTGGGNALGVEGHCPGRAGEMSGGICPCTRRLLVIIRHAIFACQPSFMTKSFQHVRRPSGITCSVGSLFSLKSFYRSTRMHSADYAVATCLSVCHTPIFCRYC